MLYQWILPWLFGRPLEEALAEDVLTPWNNRESEFRTVATSAYLYKTLSQTTRAFMYQRGM
jgi:hypothetical protein